MKVDKRLRLVISQTLDDGRQIYIHSMPLSREVFENYFLVISKAFAAIFQNNLAVVSGPRVAAMLLKATAESMGVWESPGGVKDGLMEEIRRLTNVILPNPQGGGWMTLPYANAVQRELINEDDQAEAEGEIVFFTLISAMHKRDFVPGVLEAMNGLWATQNTLFNVTEFARSLPTSTETELFIEKAGLSVPF